MLGLHASLCFLRVLIFSLVRALLDLVIVADYLLERKGLLLARPELLFLLLHRGARAALPHARQEVYLFLVALELASVLLLLHSCTLLRYRSLVQEHSVLLAAARRGALRLRWRSSDISRHVLTASSRQVSSVGRLFAKLL